MATILEKVLAQKGLKLEELGKEEVATLTSWINVMQERQLTIEKVKGFVSSLKTAVEQELTHHTLENKQDIFLKARLRNLMLLEGFLSTPDIAKQQLEMALNNLVDKVG